MHLPRSFPFNKCQKKAFPTTFFSLDLLINLYLPCSMSATAASARCKEGAGGRERPGGGEHNVCPIIISVWTHGFTWTHGCLRGTFRALQMLSLSLLLCTPSQSHTRRCTIAFMAAVAIALAKLNESIRSKWRNWGGSFAAAVFSVSLEISGKSKGKSVIPSGCFKV